MSVLKSGFTVLFLAIPFLLYGVWQARGLADVRALVSDPPADKGIPSKEQIDFNRAKTDKWVSDSRTLESLAFQFRQPGPGDVVNDPDGKALVGLIADRSAELINLEKFLSDVDEPEYLNSKLKKNYVDWQSSKKDLARAAKNVEAWFLNSLTGIDGPDSANQAVTDFQKVLGNYTMDTRFADPNKAAGWRVQCRIEVIKSLENAAKEPYIKVLNLPLPLPSENESADVRKALGAPRAILDQVRLLKIELSQDEEAHLTLPDRLLADAKEAVRRADEWSAKEELLSLFADPEPLHDPSKAGDWIARVESQYTKTQTDSQRSLIRKKVQQFCNAFIPLAARLDSVVLIKGNPVPRLGVRIVYDSDAKTKMLSDHPNELNEFNFETRFPNPDHIEWANGAQTSGTFTVLQPTERSRLARAFTQARAAVTIWSLAETTQLKKKCAGEVETVKVGEANVRRALVDELIGIAPPDTPGRVRWTKENSRIWTRLTVLSEAMVKFPALFGAGS